MGVWLGEDWVGGQTDGLTWVLLRISVLGWGGMGPRVLGLGACLRRQGNFPLLRPSPSIAAVTVPWARDGHYSCQEFTPLRGHLVKNALNRIHLKPI